MSKKQLTLLLTLATAGASHHVALASSEKADTVSEEASASKSKKASFGSSILVYEAVAIAALMAECYIGEAVREYLALAPRILYTLILTLIAGLCTYTESLILGEENKGSMLYRGLGYLAAIFTGSLVGSHMGIFIETKDPDFKVYLPFKEDELKSLTVAHDTDNKIRFAFLSFYGLPQVLVVSSIVALTTYILDLCCGCEEEAKGKA